MGRETPVRQAFELVGELDGGTGRPTVLDAVAARPDPAVPHDGAGSHHLGMVSRPAQRAPLVLGVVTGGLVLLACLAVQLLSLQPPTSAFRLVWDALGLGGLLLLLLSAWTLRRRAAEDE